MVKIADFGLSDFYRPGATMKSTCGTLSFLAPEVFKGTSNAGPPLDVWSLGVILFTMLCGRLPFEGQDLIGTKRPREQIIKSRIMKCQYKIDDHLGPEVKDLVRRMLQVDPSERASIPEIFNHVWMRTAVGGCLPDCITMQSPPSLAANQSSRILPSTPETGTPLLTGKSVKIFEDEEADAIPPLERADSLPAYNISKVPRSSQLLAVFSKLKTFLFPLSHSFHSKEDIAAVSVRVESPAASRAWVGLRLRFALQNLLLLPPRT